MANAKNANPLFTNVDALFGNPTPQETENPQGGESIVRLPLASIHPYEDNPYGIRMTSPDMLDLMESVERFGIEEPLIVRPRADGEYEVISGHRRRQIAQTKNMADLPCIIRNMDDDEAAIKVVDLNIKRDDITPSEKAKAYKMKLDAIKRQGARTDLTSRQLVGKLETADIIGLESKESGRTVQRFIRLNELEPTLLQMVDDKKLAMTPAVEMSYLKPEEQRQVAELMDLEQRSPSLSQAQHLKKLSQENSLTEDMINAVFIQQRTPMQTKSVQAASTDIATKEPDFTINITIKQDKLNEFFPKGYSPKQMEDLIFKLLADWQKQQKKKKDKDKDMAR